MTFALNRWLAAVFIVAVTLPLPWSLHVNVPEALQGVAVSPLIYWGYSVVEGICIYFALDWLLRKCFEQMQTASEVKVQKEVAALQSRYVAAISHDFGTPINNLRYLVDSIESAGGQCGCCEKVGRQL